MEIEEIERLVQIIREAKISELTVSSGGSRVRLRKSLRPVAEAAPVSSVDRPTLQLPEEREQAGVYITAPIVGIFHSMDSLGGVGGTVKAGQVVCTIESMKLMNDIVSEHDGTIAEILVEDGVPVEYGQQLFRLETE